MLIAPLDWGLGHTTRCIPLIEKFLSAGFKVIAAAEGDQKILLQKEFPSLEIVDLSGYKLKYGRAKWQTIVKLIFQIPKILISINRENRWLRDFFSRKHVDIIIADNRYGLHNKNAISIFITHQLYIKTSLGKFADAIIQKLNYRFINQFDQCWIPDAAGETNIAGELSHPAIKPIIPLQYTGVLSRINKEETVIANKLLILLSGPEPQRSILEELLLQQLKQTGYPAIVVRGLPAAKNNINPPHKDVIIYNHLPRLQLQHIINQTEIIISRSGYSTLMDVLPLGKKCILIPTPGQGEQEYLAALLTEKKYACVAPQDNFSLIEMIKKTSALQVPDLSLLKENVKVGALIKNLEMQLNDKRG